MRERTRYRISGSLFLLALAVIFVPMIFDGSATTVTAIPPRPETAPVERIQNYDEVVPASTVVQEVQELAEEVDEFGFAISTGEKFGEPILSAESEATELWAVQAASFSQLNNATALRQRLREVGLESFISTAVDPSDADATPMYRVAVGPYQVRADAVRTGEQIKAQFDLTSRVVEMQP